MQLCLVANRAKLVGSRTVSFSAVLFVTDEFCVEARSKLPPYLGFELTRQYLSGELAVLNREQVARANAGAGLNAIVCFEGWAHDGLSSEQVLAVRARQGEALRLGLSGYRVKEFLAYPLGEEALQWMLMKVLASDAIIPITFETVLFFDQYFRNGDASSGSPKKRLLRILAAA